jgi:hypothetical protein
MVRKMIMQLLSGGDALLKYGQAHDPKFTLGLSSG